MKIIAVFCCLMVLVACCEKPSTVGTKVVPVVHKGMSNDDVISETHKCESAGLNAQALHVGDDWTTTAIQCMPRTIPKE